MLWTFFNSYLGSRELKIWKELGQKRAGKDFNSSFVLFLNVNECEQNGFFS